MREIDARVLTLHENTAAFENFIKEYEFFILKNASRIAKHFVSKEDDEWSIALIAFSDAIKKYDFDKGHFLPFAEMVMRTQMIDYFRAQGKFQQEMTVDALDDETFSVEPAYDIKFEIEAITEVLAQYGFSFMDLASVSPKAQKTKKSCCIVINYMLKHPILIKEMSSSKMLPIKILKFNTGVPRKIIERHRKYIIAAVEILRGEYPHLSEYISCD